MAQRSLNKVQLIGNLTRDPELRYTPQGTAVCTFGLATNRVWVTDTGEKKEETEFHRLVAWNKLAELCSQLLFKGRRIYVEGRLQTRHWTAADGTQRQSTEIVISDMMILDSRRASGETEEKEAVPAEEILGVPESPPPEEISPSPDEGEGTSVAGSSLPTAEDSQENKNNKKKKTEEKGATVDSSDIPF